MKKNLKNANGEQRVEMAVFPPEALMTEERWAQIEAADRLHQQPPAGHNVTVERGEYNRKPMERPACSCGWLGEWERVR